jgi:hypothetical protein
MSRRRYLLAYEEWITRHNLKCGDKVRVIRSFSNNERDCGLCNNGYIKDEMVGKIYTIGRIGRSFIAINGLWFPYFVLKKCQE